MAKKTYDLLFKLLLIGDSGVGKTCILFRFSDDAFNTTFISTIEYLMSSDFVFCLVLGLYLREISREYWSPELKLQESHDLHLLLQTSQGICYKIPEQLSEYFRNGIVPIIGLGDQYNNYNGSIFVDIIDINEGSSGALQSPATRPMISDCDMRHANEDVEKMILGNKCDMEDKRVIAKEKGESIAREHGIRFLETSAKANINIEQAFLELAEAILNKTPGRDPQENPDNVVRPDKRSRDGGAARQCCA
ncbi:ras-related protein Rab-10-like [Penaeus indicus]|uniref:ras-related protein Rab-10-like n=1 Tax=Penaeus indicus TaxID=29960 RepID=UPI00300D67D6